MKAALIFPHQLFRDHPALQLEPDLVALSEDPLFFRDERYTVCFHRQKLLLHRASMQGYADRIRLQGCPVSYFEFANGGSTIDRVISSLKTQGVQELLLCDVSDYVLTRRVHEQCGKHSITISWLDSPGFINTDRHNAEYRATRKRWYMADFYKWQRRRLNILLDAANEPHGGKWSFDEENRKKIPKKAVADLPAVSLAAPTNYSRESSDYIDRVFPDSTGQKRALLYPSTHEAADQWLDEFLDNRFNQFGPYEDAIVEDHNWLYHSVLTPALNIGLLSPMQIVNRALDHAQQHNTPLASVEGFIRQIIGWREFMRATYRDIGVPMRTGNHWQHHHSMPDAFYTGTTGVLPVDNAIRRVLDTGYCHHIERLMVLGGFMFLCEIDPDDIYRWFMELFVDSYDWVMVPNVYAMSQNADGGLITTKPYFSGSNYIRKMSHYPAGEWSEIWDALYWRWIFKQSSALAKNPRWAMMVRNGEKMDENRKEQLLQKANHYLDTLHA